MKKILLVITLISASILMAAWTSKDDTTSDGKDRKINTLSRKEIRQGWKLLFDGKSFNGWTGLGRDHIPVGSWTITDGMIHKVNTGNEKTLPDGRAIEGGDLVTVQSFENFELVFEWKILKRGNSGVKYNLYNQQFQGSEPSTAALGFEYQLLDDKDESYKSLLPSQYTGSLYEMIAAKNPVQKPLGEFNESRIIVNGISVEHWLNGIKVLEYDFGSKELTDGWQSSKFRKYPGFPEKRVSGIVLQNHNEEAWFRNIRIRKLE